MGKMIIYQVLPRLWGQGKFSEFDSETMSYFKSLGVSHVWYTGVIRHATTASAEGCPASDRQIVKGAAGSPYAITDYYDVNPYLADNPSERMSEFEALLKKTHDAGLKVIIDFVPNHVSRDYGKVGLAKPDVKPLGVDDDPTVHWRAENDFYYYPGQPLKLPFDDQTYYENPAKASGNCFSPSPSVNDWYETIRLNYCDFHTQTWDRMYDIVRYWCGRGVDGFRCDMVEMVPWQFFRWLIRKIKDEFPEIVFIAEVYQKELYAKFIREVGFDFLYDKSGLYDSVRAVVEGRGTARSLTWNWHFLGDLQPKMLNFLENHDEQRFASDFFGRDARRTFAALGAGLFLNTAPYMVYFGEETGERGMDAEGFSGRDGRTSIFDWWSIPSIGRLIGHIHGKEELTPEESALLAKWRKFLNIAASVPAVASGKTFDLCYCNYGSPGFDPDRHFAFLRGDGSQTWLFVCNFSDVETLRQAQRPEGQRSPNLWFSGTHQPSKCRPTEKLSIFIPMEAIDYLNIKNLGPETRIEVEVSSDDCAIVRVN